MLYHNFVRFYQNAMACSEVSESEMKWRLEIRAKAVAKAEKENQERLAANRKWAKDRAAGLAGLLTVDMIESESEIESEMNSLHQMAKDPREIVVDADGAEGGDASASTSRYASELHYVIRDGSAPGSVHSYGHLMGDPHPASTLHMAPQIVSKGSMFKSLARTIGVTKLQRRMKQTQDKTLQRLHKEAERLKKIEHNLEVVSGLDGHHEEHKAGVLMNARDGRAGLHGNRRAGSPGSPGSVDVRAVSEAETGMVELPGFGWVSSLASAEDHGKGPALVNEPGTFRYHCQQLIYNPTFATIMNWVVVIAIVDILNLLHDPNDDEDVHYADYKTMCMIWSPMTIVDTVS